MSCLEDELKVIVLAEHFGMRMAEMRDFSKQEGVCKICSTYHMLVGVMLLAKQRGVSADDMVYMLTKSMKMTYGDDVQIIDLSDAGNEQVH